MPWAWEIRIEGEKPELLKWSLESRQKLMDFSDLRGCELNAKAVEVRFVRVKRKKGKK